MYFSRKCKITYICHGATIYSEEGRFSDTENYPPLSDLGEEEMKSVIGYLKARGVKNDVIYSSPSVRTCQSAEFISKLFKKDYEIVNELKPRECGKWNGLTFDQIFEKFPGGFEKIISEPDKRTVADAESSVEFITRIDNVVKRLVEQNIGNRIIIVTHPEVIQAAICSSLGIGADKLPKIFIRTGSITQISYFENWASLVYSDYVPLL